jgi:hypothetical protein
MRGFRILWLVAAAGAVAGCEDVTTTAGGCECEERDDGPVRLALSCFCAELDCPTYEQALATSSSCEGKPQAVITGTPRNGRSEGCGRVVIRRGDGFTSHTYAFDERTHELVGARQTNDYAFAACGAFGYEAGVVDCAAQDSCSLCPGAENACAP